MEHIFSAEDARYILVLGIIHKTNLKHIAKIRMLLILVHALMKQSSNLTDTNGGHIQNVQHCRRTHH